MVKFKLDEINIVILLHYWYKINKNAGIKIILVFKQYKNHRN